MDLICFSDNVDELLAEIAGVAPELFSQEEGGMRLSGVTHTPAVRAGAESLAVCRHLPPTLRDLDHLTVLGHVAIEGDEPVAVLGTDTISEADALALYERVWPGGGLFGALA